MNKGSIQSIGSSLNGIVSKLEMLPLFPTAASACLPQPKVRGSSKTVGADVRRLGFQEGVTRRGQSRRLAANWPIAGTYPLLRYGTPNMKTLPHAGAVNQHTIFSGPPFPAWSPIICPLLWKSTRAKDIPSAGCMVRTRIRMWRWNMAKNSGWVAAPTNWSMCSRLKRSSAL